MNEKQTLYTKANSTFVASRHRLPSLFRQFVVSKVEAETEKTLFFIVTRFFGEAKGRVDRGALSIVSVAYTSLKGIDCKSFRLRYIEDVRM